ncbi:unnamed protein product [Cunninghamella blakesleeana]
MSAKNKIYDEVYFDSDDDINSDHINIEGDQKQVKSNENLFYDPLGDEEDEAWLAEQIKKALPKKSSYKDNSPARTDAILTCPMCFSPLCYSSQRHEEYSNQFRAMFVTNCKINKTERYRYNPTKTKKSKKGIEMDQDDEYYYIVNCETCDTHVAMMDKDEVYHFFNVIAN